MINLIAAVARNRAIGYHNQLLYWLPNDMKRFRQLTTGHTIVMGRLTFESLPKGALPNRRNIVLSRSTAEFRNAERFTSVDEVLCACQPDEDIFVIGGASVYKQFLPYADHLLLTEVDNVPEKADAFFPEYSDWTAISSEQYEADERHAFPYRFVDYVKSKDF